MESGLMQLEYIGTDNNVADFMTKSLRGKKFNRFRLAVLASTDVDTMLIL